MKMFGYRIHFNKWTSEHYVNAIPVVFIMLLVLEAMVDIPWLETILLYIAVTLAGFAVLAVLLILLSLIIILIGQLIRDYVTIEKDNENEKD
jgi:hypothetical protein